MLKNLKLKAAIVESGFSRKELAEKLGICLGSLQNKLNAVTEFKANEINTLSKFLNINDIKSVFFDANVDK